MYDRLGQTVKKPATCAKIVKVLTYLSAFMISGFGLVGLIYMIINNVISTTFFLVFSPIFVILFGGIIIAVELRVKAIMDSFEFLQTMIGKGLFYIYVSSSVFYFFTCGGYENTALAWGCSMTLFGLGILFSVLHFSSSSYSNSMKAELSSGNEL